MQRGATPFVRYSFLVAVFLALGLVFPDPGLAAQISVFWSPNTEPELAGYKVYYGTASRTYTASVDVGKATTHTVTALVAGQTYFLCATAYDGFKEESDFSNEATAVASEEGQSVVLTTSADPAGAGVVIPAGTTSHARDEVVTVSATAQPGYWFTGWSGDLSGSGNPASVTMSGPKNVMASFKPVAVAETITPPGIPEGATHGSIGMSCAYTTGNASSSLGHAVQYQFDWRGDQADLSDWAGATQSRTWAAPGTYQVRARARCAICSGVISGWSSPLAVSITQASSPMLTYTVLTDPPKLQVVVDGTVYRAPHSFSWTPGSTHTLSIPSPQNKNPATRYVFRSWSDGEAQTRTVTMPSSETTVTASFTTQHSLTCSAPNPAGGAASLSGANWYDANQVVSVSATPSVGYYFKGWSGALTGTENPASVLMDGPKKLKANFRQSKYAIALASEPAQSGSVSRSPGKSKYAYGDQVTLTAKPAAGYGFSHWSGDISGQENPLALTVNGNLSIRANYVLQVASAAPTVQAATPESESSPLIGALESPLDGRSVSGVRPIYGWALDEEGISKVELFVDGQCLGDIPYGGRREDLKDVYPQYVDAAESGFASVFNYSLLSPGEHTVQVRVHNVGGERLDLGARVWVNKFHGETVSQTLPAQWVIPGLNVTVDGVTRTYDLRLEWANDSQAFEISEIVGK